MTQIIFLFAISVVLTACNTLYETTSSAYTNQPLPIYQKETNNQAETVYRSREPISSSLYQPLPIYEHTHESVSTNRKSISSQTNETTSETSTISKTESSSSLKGLVAFTEFASESNNSHIGFHLGKNIIDTPLVPRLGVSLFNSDHQMYAGFDGSVRIHLPNPNFSPFVGVGVYIGDTKKCTYKNNGYNGYEECEKKFLTSGYTEMGIQVKSVQAFLRNYKINRAGISIPSDQFWGIGLSFGGELF